jgi:hypothetical protein
LAGVQFPPELTELDLSMNHNITSLEGVQFPSTLMRLSIHGAGLKSLTGIISPNKYVKQSLKQQFLHLYLRDLHPEMSALKAARQSQKAEFARTNDLTQQSMRNQLNAITSFLREGMQARAMAHDESVKQRKSDIFVRLADGTLYHVPLTTGTTVQNVLDYLNEHYYISVLNPNHGVVRLMFKNEQLDPSRTLGDYGIQNEATLHAKGKIIQGGGKRRITTRSKRFKQQFNKSKSIKKRT